MTAPTPQGTGTAEGDDLLARIRQERGYTLSYHEIYARLEPRFLEAYAGLYRACTLDARSLPPAWRETVWVALLNSIREEVGSIHLERAAAAGVGTSEVLAAIRLAAVAEAWESLDFAFSHWQSFVEGESRDESYLGLVDQAAAPLSGPLVDLVLMVVHAARRRGDAFLLHLGRCLAAGVPEEQVGEALSYVMQPVGANRLLWATDLWLAALRDGRLPPSTRLGRPDPTRTA
jgi:alkylhydroperoxidase/carboxymuconolactone decarboxylase family protein YurZ